MNTEDESIRTYFDLRPRDYPVVVRLVLIQSSADMGVTPEFCLELTLAPAPTWTRRRLCLVFDNVRQLRLAQPEWSVFHVEPFQITSIRSSQWEGINYEVKESDTLHFLCRSFMATMTDYIDETKANKGDGAGTGPNSDAL